MAKSIKYTTVVTGIKEVILEGVLDYEVDVGWYLLDDVGKTNDLGDWLDKFVCKYVSITIKDIGADDDADLLDGAELIQV